MLFADNLEIRNIYTDSNRLESKIIEKYIWPWWDFRVENISDQKIKEFINDLKWIWVYNILLFKEADYKLYEDFLEQIKEKWYIKIEKENKMIILYKIID